MERWIEPSGTCSTHSARPSLIYELAVVYHDDAIIFTDDGHKLGANLLAAVQQLLEKGKRAGTHPFSDYG